MKNTLDNYLNEGYAITDPTSNTENLITKKKSNRRFI